MAPLSSFGHEPAAYICRGGRGMIDGEPTLEELLSEPMVLRVAEADGLSAEELRALVDRVKAKVTRLTRPADALG